MTARINDNCASQALSTSNSTFEIQTGIITLNNGSKYSISVRILDPNGQAINVEGFNLDQELINRVNALAKATADNFLNSSTNLEKAVIKKKQDKNAVLELQRNDCNHLNQDDNKLDDVNYNGKIAKTEFDEIEQKVISCFNGFFTPFEINLDDFHTTTHSEEPFPTHTDPIPFGINDSSATHPTDRPILRDRYDDTAATNELLHEFLRQS